MSLADWWPLTAAWRASREPCGDCDCCRRHDTSRYDMARIIERREIENSELRGRLVELEGRAWGPRPRKDGAA